MATRSLLVLLCACVALLGGCLESKEATTLKADGSGTITATYKTDKAKLGQLIDMAKMMMPPEEAGAQAPEGLPDPFHPAWFRSAAKEAKGFTIDEATYKDGDESRSTEVKASFQNLAAAAKGGAFFNAIVVLERTDWPEKKGADEAPKKDGAGGGENDAGAEEVTKPVKAWRLRIKPLVAGEIAGMKVQEAVTLVQAQLDTMELSRTLTLPTKILFTNVDKSEDGKGVVQKVTYEHIAAGKTLELVVVFEDAPGLQLEPMSFTPNMEGLMPRFLQEPPKQEEKATPVTPDATTPDKTDGTPDKTDGEGK
jgi:hypothetical protein